MKIKLMRTFDYWLGIPLCLLLNLFNSVLNIIRFKRKKKSTVQKILFIKLSEMGSIVLACPLIKQVKEKHPQAEILFVTFKKKKPIFEILDILPRQNILSIRSESFWCFTFDTLKILAYLNKRKIDVAFDLELFSRFTAIFNYLSGARKRIGFYRFNIEGLYRGNLLTHKVQYNPLLHISKSYFSLYQTMAVEIKSTPELKDKIADIQMNLPVFASREERRKKVMARLQQVGVAERHRLVLINPGEGKIPLREWPLENFVSLAKKILNDDRNYLLAVGTQEASKRTKLLSETINNRRCLDLTAQTTLPEMMELFNIAQVLVSNDCGLAHIAALSAIKKIVLFGPESPQLYGPLGDNTKIIEAQLACSPCLSAFNHRNSACRDNRCMQSISVEEVYNQVLTVLG